MEHRTDWEKILLDGLPPEEREQTLRSIAQTTADKRRRIQDVHERGTRRVQQQMDDDDHRDGVRDEGDLQDA